MHARKLINSTKLLINPEFPSLADGIAEPRPDKNIKVPAFTVSEKSSNIRVRLVLTLPLIICCSKSGKSYQNNWNLSRHQANCGISRRRFSCDHCRKQFKAKQYLKEHIES